MRFRGLAGALARRGHELHLMEPVPAGAAPETPPGVKRHPCPRLPIRPEAQVPIWAWHSLAAVRRSRPDICWILKALPNVWAAAWLARRGGSRVAVDLDDLDWGYYSPGPARSIVRAGFERLARFADDVTVHNEPMRQLVRQLRPDASEPVFVDQGIEPGRFGAAANADLRNRWQLGQGPVLLYAGHLGPASDLGALLPALVRVPAEFPEARLLVVGDGRVRAALAAQAERVLPAGFARFVGAVDHREVGQYYALADVALNFLEENEPNRFRASIKLREALAAGVPVVASRTPDSERFGKWATLTDGSAASFVDGVLAELRAPDRERAAAGQRWLAEHGTHDAAVRDIARRWEGKSP